MKIEPKDLIDPIIDGINTKDYPDFCDAYLSEAYVEENGVIRELTQEEINDFNGENSEWIHEKIFDDQLYL